MGNTFNPQILAEKLSKLNSSQQSIETLSHWCIFHMNKAKQVVETWDRQFHCSPREQRLAFLYLANDILQNSRRKGAEFVAEFWRVLPDSLHDVIENGDEFAGNAVLRLISIWEDRKVFGSRGQILKEEFGKRQLNNGDKNRKPAGVKLRSPGGNALDKLVSGYEAVYSSQLDEESILTKCRNAIGYFEKVDRDVNGDFRLDHVNSSIGEELKKQHAILRDCIEQLALVESSRAKLVSLLRDALQEQVYKLGQVREILQAAQTCSEQVGDVTRSNAVTCTQQVPITEKPCPIEEDTKSAAAAIAAKLAASSSSAQMLTYVLSSLASEGAISSSNPIKESSSGSPEKRVKIENKNPSYVTQNPQPPPLTTLPELNPVEPPPPPSSPPPMPPPPPMQSYPVLPYVQTAMPMLGGEYGYNPSQQQPVNTSGYTPAGHPLPGVSPFAPSANGYQNYQPEGGFYGQTSSVPMAPMSRQ